MKLGIGTAQFGLDYGISNQEGKTPPDEVRKILEIASLNQVKVIDTAPAYGDSEEVLGKSLPSHHRFDIVTKTPKFYKSAINSNEVQLLEETFYQSLSKLNQSSIYGLLVHHVDNILAKGGHKIIKKMIDIKDKGLIKKIGVSVYNSREIDLILEKYLIDFIQIPINVIDQRLLLSGHLHELKKLGIEIHARSVFMQGLLLMTPEQVPCYFNSIRKHLQNYHNFIKQQNSSPIQAAMNFVLGLSEIDTVLVGINTSSHLEEIIFETVASKRVLTTQNYRQFAITEPSVLNPSEWKL